MIDVVWIGIAFGLGLLARQVGLPPLVGFLLAGFVLSALGRSGGETLQTISDLGITLLLFTIGLKLKIGSLLRPQVWGVASLHLIIVSIALGGVLLALAGSGLELLSGLRWPQCLLLGFALSFSSTVFGMKVLEGRADVSSVYGTTIIGILIVQDLAAVAFLAASTGKLPSWWALLLVPGLWPLRWVLFRTLERAGHGELLVLFGLTIAVGGDELFRLVGLKGDLGALTLGVLLAAHRSADELAKALFAFKDLFLLGFFLSVGMQGLPGAEAWLIAITLVLLVAGKSFLFFWLLVRFRMRSRTSLLAALGLASYSEFGLIVAALAGAQGWLDPAWLTVLALTLALSFVAASPVNERVLALYRRHRERLLAMQHPRRRPEEQEIEPQAAEVLIFGMGRVGTGAYDELHDAGFRAVVGIDSAADVAARHEAAGRQVIRASGTDLDFWDRLRLDPDKLRLVLLALPRVEENEFAARQLRQHGYRGRVGALVKYPDEGERLQAAGVDRVYNLYQEAGAGLALDTLASEAAAD